MNKEDILNTYGVVDSGVFMSIDEMYDDIYLMMDIAVDSIEDERQPAQGTGD